MTASTTASPPLPGMNACARQATVEIVEHIQLARDTYRLRLATPEIAAQSIPGQFFMIRPAQGSDPLLGRPFALYDTWFDASGKLAGIDVVYLVVGRMTRLMSGWSAGDRVVVWGPLGNGFPLPETDRLLMVAGGIGNTPFMAVGREALGLRRYGSPQRQPAKLPRKVSFCYGVRSQEYLAGLADFSAMNLPVHIATDDGSQGHHGFVTDLVRQQLQEPSPPTAIYCCGPEPMMHAVSRLAQQHGVACWLSLETPMACGFGACFSCVTRVKLPEGGWDYRRTCVEGPIFPASELWL